MKNKILDSCYIKQSFTLETWFPANFTLELAKYNYSPSNTLIKDDSSINDKNMKYSYFINKNFIKNTSDGKLLLDKGTFLPDLNTEIDIINIKSMLNSNIYYIIDLLFNNGYDLTKIMDIKVYADEQELLDGMFTLDFNTFDLTTNKPESNKVYTVCIYYDMIILNKVIKIIEDNKEDDIKELLII